MKELWRAIIGLHRSEGRKASGKKSALRTVAVGGDDIKAVEDFRRQSRGTEGVSCVPSVMVPLAVVLSDKTSFVEDALAVARLGLKG